MNKKVVLIFLLGWAFAYVLPPQRVTGKLMGKSGG
jgi:hypothetical protein